MGNYAFSTTIPAANHDPGVDQPTMLSNNVSNSNIWDQDHVGFNAANGGTHEQMTFFSNVSGSIGSALAVAYPGSRPGSYTNSTGSSATNAYLVNTDASSYPLPLSCIKAGGTVLITPPYTPTFTTQFNCASVAVNVANTSVNITLQSGVTTGDKVIVLLSGQNANNINSWSFSGGVLTVGSASNAGSYSFSFLVIQV